LVEDLVMRDLAAVLGYKPKEHYILFEFDVDSASATTYDTGQVKREHWKLKKDTL
jgi:hypothetical protein